MIFALISITLVALLSYKIYKWCSPPEALKNVPIFSLTELLISIIKGEPYDERQKRVMKNILYTKGCARIWQQGRWELITSNLKNIKYILNNTNTFLKNPEFDKISSGMLAQKFFGDSNILDNDKEEWKRHRRIINSAFKKSWPVEVFGNCVLEMVSVIDKSQNNVVLVHDVFQRLTLDILGKVLFSYNFNSLKKNSNNSMLDSYNLVMEGIFNPIYTIFPFLEKTPWRQVYHHKNYEFRDYLKNIIQERLYEIKQNKIKDDIITLMLKNSLESNENPLTQEEIINNLATFFLAGHDTTANTLTSVLFYLAKYPKIQDRVYNEIVKVMKGQSNTFPTLDQQKGFTYMSCVIKESMRIITTVPGLKRYCSKDEVLPDGLVVPKGTFINMQMWALHHDPKVFPNPDVFEPNRYLNSTSEQANSWMPFGGGTRLCIGINFSLIEQKITLAILLQKYKIQLGPNFKNLTKPKLISLGLVYPKDLDIKFIKRKEN